MAKASDQVIEQGLAEIVRTMQQVYSLDISGYEESFLAKTTKNRLTATSLKNISEYRGYLSKHPKEAHLLSRSLNINYSKFFRNTLSFALLEHLILPRILERKRNPGSPEIRVWSAGCASGEEAYSIAILLNEINISHQLDIPFHICATDISDSELAAAQKGAYHYEAVKNVELQHIRQYFTVKGDIYMVAPPLPSQVIFSHYDLLDKHTICPPESIYGNFDLILCNNLLFYYQPEIQRFILNKLHQCLADGGYLMTGEAENTIVEKFQGFRVVNPSTAIYQKLDHGR